MDVRPEEAKPLGDEEIGDRRFGLSPVPRAQPPRARSPRGAQYWSGQNPGCCELVAVGSHWFCVKVVAGAYWVPFLTQ